MVEKLNENAYFRPKSGVNAKMNRRKRMIKHKFI